VFVNAALLQMMKCIIKAVEHLPSKSGTLCLNPHIAKKKIQEKNLIEDDTLY
jgi:hypothetical protein